MKIRVGSRDSRLAVLQSEIILRGIAAAAPAVELELVTMKTTGDRILHKPLDEIGGKGLFVKELDQALRDGRVDFTVHSLKDLPLDVPEDLPLAAFSQRADPRDVLVLPAGAAALDPAKPIGCSSRRRQLQLRALYPGMEFAPVRGNVLTRLRKLDEGAYSAPGPSRGGLAAAGAARPHQPVFQCRGGDAPGSGAGDAGRANPARRRLCVPGTGARCGRRLLRRGRAGFCPNA